MALKLTPFAKVFLALVVVLVVGFTVFRLKERGLLFGGGTSGTAVAPTEPKAQDAAKPGPEKQTAADPKAGPKPARDPKRIVVGVNDFGGAYPGVVANDGALPGPASRFAAAGLDVEIRLIRGSKERLQAFDEGDVDVMLLTLDYLANLVPMYRDKQVELRAFLMADWSRGNMGIVAKPSIRSIEGLKDAKIATTRNTPTHYFLLSLLGQSNLKPDQVEKVKSNLVFATKTPLAGEMYKRGEVDAVAIWEPHLSQCLQGDKGKLLASTGTATNVVADVLFARADYLKAHEDEMVRFARAWFEGVKMLEADPEGSVTRIAKAFAQTPEETGGVLKKIKPATFADNRAFFGLERERAPYLWLFEDAGRVWQREGVIREPAPAAPTRWLKALEALNKEHASEQVVERFDFKAGPKKDAEPMLTKSVSIYFASGSDKLDPNSRKLLDGFAETLAGFGNAYVRVEGNTDSTGNRMRNVELSQRRAQAVVTYLSSQHGFDKARFQAVGNGPDKPVGDNQTEDGRDMNRRTDFQIIPNL